MFSADYISGEYTDKPQNIVWGDGINHNMYVVSTNLFQKNTTS